MHALIGDGDPDEFFSKVRDGNKEKAERWTTYLKQLAVLIGNLHLVRDVDFILGGHLAPYFTDADIDLIYQEIHKICPFEDANDFLLISKMPSHNINIGSALPFIQEFLTNVTASVPGRQ